jgi:biopolymer transport protein ExbB
MQGESTMDRDQKVLAIQKEIEEATSLELPMLEKNLVIIATMASVSTLVALLGTVLGMIKAFSALGNAGAPDSTALATGISEALINTALGIGNSAVAIIMYNVLQLKLIKLLIQLTKLVLAIVQNFASAHKR